MNQNDQRCVPENDARTSSAPSNGTLASDAPANVAATRAAAASATPVSANSTPANVTSVAKTFLAPAVIKQLREERHLTQRQLAGALGVTDKAVSKWESGRGLPDITLVEPLARELGVSVAELLAGDVRANANRAGNMLRSAFYVCPICGNVLHAMGEGSFSCCGSAMLPLEAEEPDDAHAFTIERIEDDWFVTLDHPMTKDHYVSFVAYVTSDGICLKKLYPEQMIQPRFHITGSGWVYLYCNKHGLFKQRTPRRQPVSR